MGMIESLRATINEWRRKPKDNSLSGRLLSIHTGIENDRWLFRYTDPKVGKRMLGLAERSLPIAGELIMSETAEELAHTDAKVYTELFDLLSFWLNKHSSIDPDDSETNSPDENVQAQFALFSQTTQEYFDYLRAQSLIPTEGGRVKSVEEYFFVTKSDCPPWLKKQLIKKYYQEEAQNWRQMQQESP